MIVAEVILEHIDSINHHYLVIVSEVYTTNVSCKEMTVGRHLCVANKPMKVKTGGKYFLNSSYMNSENEWSMSIHDLFLTELTNEGVFEK